MSDRERIVAFEHQCARAQATDVVSLDCGFAVLQAEFPLSHEHNRFVVTSPAPADDILAAAETVLGGARHRYVSIDDDALGVALWADFEAAGYDHEVIVAMVFADAEVEEPEHEVQAVSLAALRPAIIRDWRALAPDVRDEELEQLGDRTSLYERAADWTRLAVLEGDEIAAHADLFIDRAERIGQFENVVTGEAFRRRGYGAALVADALRRSEAAGCDLRFLTVALNDWTFDWYQRLGYVESCRTHHFTRVVPH